MMKNLITLTFLLTTILLTGQTTITWNGGTPGSETNWDEPKNWSGHQLPDEFSFVLIKKMNSGHNAQPIIKSEVDVTAIEIHNGASLTVAKTGQLTIDGENTNSKGLVQYGGQLILEGELLLLNIRGEVENKDIAKLNEMTDKVDIASF